MIGCQRIAASRQIKKKMAEDEQEDENDQEAVEVDQKLSESQKFALYKELQLSFQIARR